MSKITYRVEGASTRVINKLYYHDIKVYDTSVHDDYTIFSIDSQDKVECEQILDDLSFCYQIVKYNFRHSVVNIMKNRLGIILGAIVTIMLLVSINLYTLKITILGNTRVDTDDIMASLSSMNIREHSLKVSALDSINNELLARHREIAFVSCKYRGSELIVTIHEELPKPDIVVDKNGNIIANYDGIISRMIVRSGTPLVAVGDSVRHGDILVAPYKVESDEVTKTPVTADAEIYARVYLTEDITLFDESVVLEDTGRIKRINRLFTKASPKSPFKNYALKIEKHRLFSILPLEYTSYVFSEKKEVKVSGNNKIYRDFLIKCANERIKTQIFEGEKVFRHWIFEKRLDNLTIISVYYEVEKLISGGNA